MLTKGGWVATISIALVVVYAGMTVYLVYPISFLIIGSAASRLNPQNADNNGRNTVQVLSNAGVGALMSLMYILTQDAKFTSAFTLSFGIAMSDTLSSEIGKKYGGRPIDIVRLKKLDNGLSGGVSLAGMCGGVLGAFLISIILLVHKSDTTLGWYIFAWSFLGMIVDSVLGSTIQAKYILENRTVEHGERSSLVSGFHAIDNNMVNFLSILSVVLLYLLIH